MPEEIALRFRYTEAEWISAVRTYYSRILHLKIDLVVGLVAITAGVTAWILWGYSVANVLIMVGGAVLLIYVFLALVLIPKLSFGRQPKLRDEYSLCFSNQGIRFKTQHIDSNLQWALYTDVWEGPDSYLLLYGKGLFSVVPKRLFESEEQELLFRELLKRHISPNL